VIFIFVVVAIAGIVLLCAALRMPVPTRLSGEVLRMGIEAALKVDAAVLANGRANMSGRSKPGISILLRQLARVDLARLLL
jgi:hypothetical protein